MRDRPYIAAGESPRRFSEIIAERNALDPIERGRERVLDEIARLEGEASAMSDPEKRKTLQCEAEALRCGLVETWSKV